AWHGRQVLLEPESWEVLSSRGPRPDETAEQTELLMVVQRLVATALTPHQRRGLVALAVDGVPLHVLPARLDATRGALYKMLHDARRKLRQQLAESGLVLDGRSEEAS